MGLEFGIKDLELGLTIIITKVHKDSGGAKTREELVRSDHRMNVVWWLSKLRGLNTRGNEDKRPVARN